MRDLLGIGTNRGYSMVGFGVGLGLSGYRMQTISPPIDPLEVSGLGLWLDLNDASTVYQDAGTTLALADGDPVGRVADKSGNGRHANQTDGLKKPTLKLNYLNGKRGMQFDGSSDAINCSYSKPSMPVSIFMVARFAASGNRSLYDTAPNQQNVLRSTGATIEWWSANPSTALPFSYSQTGAFGATYYFSENRKIDVVKTDGTITTATGGTLPDFSWNTFNIGSYNNGFFLNGDIFEVLVYTGADHLSFRTKIVYYLKLKWGTP